MTDCNGRSQLQRAKGWHELQKTEEVGRVTRSFKTQNGIPVSGGSNWFGLEEAFYDLLQGNHPPTTTWSKSGDCIPCRPVCIYDYTYSGMSSWDAAGSSLQVLWMHENSYLGSTRNTKHYGSDSQHSEISRSRRFVTTATVHEWPLRIYINCTGQRCRLTTVSHVCAHYPSGTDGKRWSNMP